MIAASQSFQLHAFPYDERQHILARVTELFGRRLKDGEPPAAGETKYDLSFAGEKFPVAIPNERAVIFDVELAATIVDRRWREMGFPDFSFSRRDSQAERPGAGGGGKN